MADIEDRVCKLEERLSGLCVSVKEMRVDVKWVLRIVLFVAVISSPDKIVPAFKAFAEILNK